MFTWRLFVKSNCQTFNSTLDFVYSISDGTGQKWCVSTVTVRTHSAQSRRLKKLK